MADDVVADRSSDKRLAWEHVHFDVLFKGTDWEGTPKGNRLEVEMAEVGARLEYLPVHLADLDHAHPQASRRPHRVSRPGLLIRVLDARISRLKGGGYRLDPALTAAALATQVGRRGLMRVRGRVLFPTRTHPPFVGPGARFHARRSLTFGRGVTFGRDCLVDALSRGGVRLGDNVSVGTRTRIEATGQLQHLGAGLVVGDDVGLGADCFYGCAGGIEIGADTIVGNWVGMHSENHRFDRRDVPIRRQGVTHQGIVVGRDCWIGAKATLLDGVRLGDGSVVAAGAVLVAGDYPGGAVYGGVPARRIAER